LLPGNLIPHQFPVAPTNTSTGSAVIRGFATYGAETGPGTTAFSVPTSSFNVAPAAGDLILAFINYNNNGFNGAALYGLSGLASGWTSVYNSGVDANTGNLQVLSRTATGTTADGLSASITGDTSGTAFDFTVIVVAIQNAGTPTIGTAQVGTFVTSINVPSIGSTGDLLLVNAGNFTTLITLLSLQG
jgi:hypothetical protein